MERRKFLKLTGLSAVSVLVLRELDFISEITPTKTYPLKSTFTVTTEEELLDIFGVEGHTPIDDSFYAPYIPHERKLWLTRVPV